MARVVSRPRRKGRQGALPVLIVESRYYPDIADDLARGAGAARPGVRELAIAQHALDDRVLADDDFPDLAENARPIAGHALGDRGDVRLGCADVHQWVSE